MPHMPVPKRIMKTNPKKKKFIPPSCGRLEERDVGEKSVTPSAKKKNHSGVLMNSPTIQAG
jgi:hypothetical protein